MTTTADKLADLNIVAISIGDVASLPLATTSVARWEDVADRVKAARPMFLPPPYVRPSLEQDKA